MRSNLFVGIILAAITTVACSGGERHILTDEDIARRDAAKAQNASSWTDTEQNTHALTCVQWLDQGMQFCIVWRNDPPAGMFYCTDDTTAYSGEWLIFDQAGGGGECAGCNESNLASCRKSNIQDYNDKVRSYKNNTSRTFGVWSDAGWTGSPSFTAQITGNTATNVPSNMTNTVSSFYAW
jgi:hypothetical protein